MEKKQKKFYPDYLFEILLVCLFVLEGTLVISYIFSAGDGEADRLLAELYTPAGMVFPVALPTLQILPRKARVPWRRGDSGGCAVPDFRFAVPGKDSFPQTPG